MAKPVFNPQEIIPLFDRFLSDRRLSFSGVAIGGAALSVLGVVTRSTRDVDILEPTIPDGVKAAATAFATKHALADDWLNVGPASLVQHLTDGWRRRLQPLYSGKNLKPSTLGRGDPAHVETMATALRKRLGRG